MLDTLYANIYRPIRTLVQEYLLTVVTPPASEPVSYEQLNAQLYDLDISEQPLVTVLGQAAREIVETETKTVLMPTTFDVSFDTFDDCGLRLPVRPVTSVVSVKYLDQAGAQQTLDPSKYDFRQKTAYSKVTPKYGTCFPIASYFPNSVTIRFVAGATTVSSTAVATIKMLVTHLYENRGDEAAEFPEVVKRLLNLMNFPTV